MRISLFLKALIALFFLTGSVRAQYREQIALHSSASGEASYSPTITSGRIIINEDNSSLNPKKRASLVSAYTYTHTVSGNKVRSIGISISNDGGETWSANKLISSTDTPTPDDEDIDTYSETPITITKPEWSSDGNDLENVDDPQLITLQSDGIPNDQGTSPILLVVRAWDGDPDYYVGEGLHDQPQGSIFLRSGIYACVSLDNGNTWGYYNSSGVWTEELWKPVIENSGTPEDPSTVEYPRVAYRPDFGVRNIDIEVDNQRVPNENNVGYIVWGRIQYVDTYDDDNSVDTPPDEYSLGTTQIGIRSFDNQGNLLPVHSSPAGGPYLPLKDVEDDEILRPMRPSVAISPDKGVWLSFFAPDMGTDNDRQRGNEILPMKVYYTKGNFSISYDLGTNLYSTTFPFANCQELKPANPSEVRYAMGAWSQKYGAIIFAEPITPSSGPDIDGLHEGFNIDLASGPSIQVVCDTVSKCDPRYTVGIVYVHSTPVIEDDVVNPEKFSYHSKLSFYAGNLSYDGSAAELNDGDQTDDWITIDQVLEGDSPSEPSDYLRDKTEEQLVIDDVPVGDPHYWNLRFFPVLKYTNVTDPYGFSQSFDGTKREKNIRLYSPTFFLLGYMSGYQKFYLDVARNYPTHMTHTQCKVGVSFDNLTFRIKRYTGTSAPYVETNEDYIVGAEPHQQIYANPVPFTDYWGSKIDVSGYVNYQTGTNLNWDVHPIWKNLEYRGTPVRTIYTNTGNCILAKAYIENTASYMKDGLPSANGTHGGMFKTGTEPSGEYSWGNYAYFDFDETGKRPASLLAKSSITSSIYGTLQNEHPTAGTGKDFYTDISSASDVPYGLFYGLYKVGDEDNPVGDFGTSNQRKMVMTGDIPHLVFESDGEVYYTINRGGESAVSEDIYAFAPMMKLSNSIPESGETITRRRPSIAIYQESMQFTGIEMTGKCAIAVTWVEYIQKETTPPTPTKVKVYMRTREFDVCTYKWNEWSEPYEIHQHTYTANGTNLYSDDEDYTTPVIAPLLKEKGGIPQANFLLGWTLTWTSPQITVFTGAAVTGTRHTAIYSRTWLRLKDIPLTSPDPVITDNSYWGEYYSPSMMSTSPFRGIQPSSPNGCNVIFHRTTPLSSDAKPLDFPTVVNSENKTFTAVLQNELAYSTDGSQNGIWHKSISYHLTNTTGPTRFIGELVSASNDPFSQGERLTPNITQSHGYFVERKPCITMNSSGQKFIAWERTNRNFFPDESGNYTLQTKSSVIVRNTHLDQVTSTTPWLLGGLSYPLLEYEVDANPSGTLGFDALQNPSVTGFPKSRLNEQNNPNFDEDPGVVELLFWWQNEYPSSVTKNKLQNRFIFNEGHGNLALPPCDGVTMPAQKGKGMWQPTGATVYDPESDGINSQRSFGTINSGTSFYSVPPIGCANETELNNYQGNSHAFGNFASGASTDLTRIAMPVVGFYKGTYLSHTGLEHYRSEEFQKDSETVSFTWGEVYSGDTSTLLPDRQVKLYFDRDTNGMANYGEYHDGFYQTEFFDWQPGKEIMYWRGMSISDTSAQQTGGVFYSSAVLLKYTVELVKDSGNVIDTLEVLEFAPYYNKWIKNERKRFINGNIDAREVKLRVRISTVSGINTDSTTQVYALFRDSTCPYINDTVRIIYKEAPSGYNPLVSGKLVVEGIYPNPASSRTDISVMLKFPEGHQIEISLFDLLGREVPGMVSIESTGATQTVVYPVDLPSGSYFMYIKAGGSHITVPVVIQNR